MHNGFRVVSRLFEQAESCGIMDVVSCIPDGIHLFCSSKRQMYTDAHTGQGDVGLAIECMVELSTKLIGGLPYPCTDRQCMAIEQLFLLNRTLLELGGNPRYSLTRFEVQVLRWVLKQLSSCSWEIAPFDSVKLVYDVGDLIRRPTRDKAEAMRKIIPAQGFSGHVVAQWDTALAQIEEHSEPGDPNVWAYPGHPSPAGGLDFGAPSDGAGCFCTEQDTAAIAPPPHGALSFIGL